MPLHLTPLQKSWYKWKSLRLPWRKRFFVGFDLNHTTYWTFRPTLSSRARERRIARPHPSIGYSEIEIPVQWHQWLRYTRDLPPSVEELEGDVVRREELRYLVERADERWKGKERLVGSGRVLGEGDGDGKKTRGGPGEEWKPESWRGNGGVVGKQ